MLSIKVKGVPATIKGLDRITANIHATLTRAVRTEGERAAAAIAKRTPVRSGETQRGWYVIGPYSPTNAPGLIASTITHPWNEYGAVHPDTKQVVNDGRHNLLATLEYGSAPHRIEAKNAKALRFLGTDGVIFRRSVNHPGTQPRGMVRKTVVVERVRVPKTMAARIDTVLHRENVFGPKAPPKAKP